MRWYCELVIQIRLSNVTSSDIFILTRIVHELILYSFFFKKKLLYYSTIILPCSYWIDIMFGFIYLDKVLTPTPFRKPYNFFLGSLKKSKSCLSTLFRKNVNSKQAFLYERFRTYFPKAPRIMKYCELFSKAIIKAFLKCLRFFCLRFIVRN